MEIPQIINLQRSKVKTAVTLTDKAPQSVVESSKVCLICSENRADYCCPNCYKPYCSLKCYQRHDPQCTEKFFRDHVGKVLNLESKENVSDLTEKHSNETLVNTNPFAGITAEEIELLVAKIRSSDLSSLSPEEKEKLSKVNRMMSHVNNVWSPYWESESDEEVTLTSCATAVGKVDMERITHLRVEFLAVRTLLLNNQILAAEFPTLSYQLVGGLLGYVVMMRSTSGGWKDPLNSLGPGSESPISSLQLLLQSTPLISRSFRPLSVSQTVSDWILNSSLFLPPPCGNSNGPSRRSQAIKVLLLDVCRILSHRELLFYCLLDLWLLGYISLLLLDKSAPTPSPIVQHLSSLACSPPSQIPIADILSCHMFSSSPPSSQVKHDRTVNSILLYTKKVSYLFRYFLIRSYVPGEGVESWRQSLFWEVKAYVHEYL